MKNKPYIIGTLPFLGKWIVGNTPAHKIPSHGTNLFGVSYAYDFMAVNKKNKISSKISLNMIFGREDPKDFYAFGMSVYSPVDGKIIKVHDGEIDQKVRRSLFSGIPYLLTQYQRIEKGVEGIAGNYVIIQPIDSPYFICIVHLKKNSLVVQEGDFVTNGDKIAECGNSGNSTLPHIHIQGMDNLNLNVAKGIPLYFDCFYESKKDGKDKRFKNHSFPNRNRIIER